MQGVRAWDNAKNGFRVVRLHYTADPAKRSPEWFGQTRPGYSQTAWDQEYDIVFATHAGKGIYKQEFNNSPASDGGNLVYDFVLDKIRPIFRVWDFGYHHPAVLFVQETSNGHHVAFDELMGSDVWLQDFVPMVQERTHGYLKQCNGIVRDMCDPAGNSPKSTGRSDLEILLSNQIRPVFAQFEIKATIDYVRNALSIRRSDGIPILLVDAERCPILIDGFNGGYRYAQKRLNRRESELPLEEGYYEHLHDDMRYYAGHRLRFLTKNRKGVSNAARTSSQSKFRAQEETGVSIPKLGRTFGTSQKDHPELTGDARYPAEYRFNEKEKEVDNEVAGGVRRRQIIVGRGYGGPTYNRIPR